MEKIFYKNNDKRYIVYGTKELIDKIKYEIGENDKVTYCVIPKSQYFKHLQRDKVYIVEDKSYLEINKEYDSEFE